jgi:hypothetical protein
MAASSDYPTTDGSTTSTVPSFATTRCERASSTTTRGDTTADAAAVEADTALRDVPASAVLAGVEATADDGTDADVEVLACLDPELHAVATIANATRAAAREYAWDAVSTGLLEVGRSE